MPAQKCFGLDNQQGLLPSSNLAREQDQQDSIPWRRQEPFTTAAEDQHLLPQEGIFRDQVHSAAGYVYQQACKYTIGRGPDVVQDTTSKIAQQIAKPEDTSCYHLQTPEE
jgi:hypothetical protein